MFKIISSQMIMIRSFPGIKLGKNASSTPDVDRGCIGRSKKHFRSSIPQGHHLRFDKCLDLKTFSVFHCFLLLVVGLSTIGMPGSVLS